MNYQLVAGAIIPMTLGDLEGRFEAIQGQ